MKTILLSILSAAVFTATSAFLTVNPAYAQPRPDTSGEIKFEEHGVKKETYADTVKATAAFFDAFSDAQQSLKTGSTKYTLPPLTNDSIFYLTGLYLYCIQRSGVCRLIPDSLYEVELARAYAKSGESCNYLSRFWDLWREQGMEERAKYLVPMASIRSLSDYNEQERPKFLKCNSSVKTELEKSDSDFFAKRYATDSRRESLGKTIAQVIRQLDAKYVNVFINTGAMSQPTAKTKAK